MILFDPLFDILVSSLINHNGPTTQELYAHISKIHKISLPNFYKVIAKLLDDQIIIKESGKLFFHTRRVLGFLDIADELKQKYMTNITSVDRLQEGQSMYYEATSIRDLDGIRGDRTLAVNKKYGSTQKVYVYQAHPYYALGMKETEMAFFSQVNKLTDVYFLTGNTDFLDNYGASLYTDIGIKALTTDTLPLLKDGYCITVIGDYIFYVLYPKEISDYFKMFFITIKEMKDFNADLFARIFDMKGNCKLTLTHDKNHARDIKTLFEREFKSIR